MYTGIPYGQYLDTPICRISVDSVRLKFQYMEKAYDFEKRKLVETLNRLSEAINDLFHSHCDTKWSYCDFFKIGNYARTCTISGNDWSCAVLFGRYGFSEGYIDPDTGESFPGRKAVFAETVFDFNPNKVPADWCLRIVRILRECSLKTEIVRYDVAFDFPMAREDVTLLRNERQSYAQFYEAAKGTTEYLGERSHHAAVKLYDKTRESGLSVPVTRCEITVNGSFHSSLAKLFPTLAVFADMQLDTGFAELPFPVKACILYPDLIPQLKASVSANTWRSYKTMLSTYGKAELAPGNWKEINRFVADTLYRLRGGAA